MITFTNEQIKEIAEQLEVGFRAFFHKETGELIFVPKEDEFSSMDFSGWEEELHQLKKNPMAYREVYGMEGRDGFEVMEDFADQLSDKRLQDRLYSALNKKHPFREFKYVIDRLR